MRNVNSISILGSTGSVGRQTLEVAKHLNIKVRAIGASNSIDLLEQQIRDHTPELVAVYDENVAVEL